VGGAQQDGTLEGLDASAVWGRTGIPLQRWTHVAVTYDGTTLAVYQNGKASGSIEYPMDALPATSSPLYIGTSKNTDPNESQPFVGYLDQVMIYSVALTSTQIKALAEGLRPRVP